MCEKGQLIDGDQVLAALALALHQDGRLNGNTLVTTVMSNMGLDSAMERAGIRTVKTPGGNCFP